MAYSPTGLNDAFSGGIARAGDLLSLHTSDPGTTGAGEDVGVARLPADWGAPAGGAVDSAEVPFEIPAGGGQRTYTHFGHRRANGAYVTGGELDEPETFSDNGGTFDFTATLTAADAP